MNPKFIICCPPSNAPYIRTKPFHPSQRILELREDGAMVFELNIIINRELVRLILGYAEGLKVLTPRKLSYQVRTHLVKGAERYQERV